MTKTVNFRALFEPALYRSSARGNLNGRPFRGAVCSDPKVTYSDPKATYSDPKVTHCDPTHFPSPPHVSPTTAWLKTCQA